jgi:serine/arginine repetitive matrix protein 2
VDSIQAPRLTTSSILTESRTDTDVVADSSTEPEPSSATRRKNALARALFGASDSDQSPTSPSPLSNDEPNTGSDLLAERPPLIESSASALSLRETLSPSSPFVNPGAITASSSSTERPNKQQELAKEVQRRAEAAMADLNRMPSYPKGHDASQRRRIEPGQISGPRLVSASTSVDTIPVRSPSAASGQLSAAQNQSPSSSKFGTRFKKIRGSLRTKPTYPMDGSTQHHADLSSSYGDRSLTGTPDGPPPHSATEPSRPKLAVASPPATAATTGPGLKGFVSRFLRPRSETPDLERRKQWPSTSATVATSSYFAHQQLERHPEMSDSEQVTQSAPPDNKSFRPDTPVSPQSTSSHKQPPSAPPVPTSIPDASATRAVDESALKQFMDAANNLGLDQDALTELLARSTSISSRVTTQGSKHLSTPLGDRSGRGKSDPPFSGTTPPSAAGSSAHLSPLPSPQRPSGETIENSPIRRPVARNAATSESANSTIVRRTLIFPSEARQSTAEPGAGLLRKSSSTRRRRSTGAASISNRPLLDRVPTPPPPKSPTARRFSAEQSPPMPHIPSSLLAQTEAINAPQSAPAVPLEKSNSAYDSL